MPGVKMEFQRSVVKVVIFSVAYSISVRLFVVLGFGVGGLKRGVGTIESGGVALLALGGGMNSGVFGSKETDKLWMDEGRGTGSAG